ncbi:anthranilate synthase component I family protein [Candidatus Magnetominusculus xianensis]|uniref:Anthranilate synthase component 1 n=1 Tax=Candidatus Magnetominusculus xianensis TaxID=1748249 RepID=A0ABR5SF83_9BACT|nr:anthranilate synthase component I family protein [Candidatus Magnetominusculus xianensis]KWT85559.1 anthranilate synthase subunit I [Candidatus Magnetominusculus xianensis]MBF0404210.1 anthranilate synthase component I family protein [Nitrospirota bacterium]
MKGSTYPLYPRGSAFEAGCAESGSIAPVYKEIPYYRPADYYDVLKSKNSFLLESIKGPYNIARYSYIGFDPYLILTARNGIVGIETVASAQTPKVGTSVSLKSPLGRLRELTGAYPQRLSPELPPFQGGAVGLFSYDFVRYFEKIPNSAIDDLKIPTAHFFMIDKLIAFDHKEKKAWIVVCPAARQTRFGFNAIGTSWREYYDQAAGVIEEYSTLLKAVRDSGGSVPVTERGDVEILYNMTKSQYMDMVRRALEYIGAGDIFQANLSQRLSAEIKNASPWDIYRVLSFINPSPFACYFDFGDYHIVSSSPERLVSVVPSSPGASVETRPIAGTRPRGRDTHEDELMRAELLLNEKERAEHIMLIDLERNDIGRVCEYATIGVDELMITEEYSHVIHIVSNIRGRLKYGKDCFDVIRATFPGGTITGVPKVRCMEIIDELEPVARGPYTGSAGYIGFSSNMDLNIIIRTFVIKGGMAYVQVGAGIVADSVPEREYFETLKKAEALIRTIKAAAR